MRRRTVGLLAWVVVLVVAVAAVALIARDNRSERERSAGVDDALVRGRSAVTDLFSYEPGQLSTELRGEATLMTPAFAARYRSLIGRSVLPVATRERIRAAAVVKGASVTSSRHDRVVLLMFVNVVTSAADSPAPRAGGSRLRVTMVDRGGSWVVDDVDAL